MVVKEHHFTKTLFFIIIRYECFTAEIINPQKFKSASKSLDIQPGRSDVERAAANESRGGRGHKNKEVKRRREEQGSNRKPQERRSGLKEGFATSADAAEEGGEKVQLLQRWRRRRETQR